MSSEDYRFGMAPGRLPTVADVHERPHMIAREALDPANPEFPPHDARRKP